MYYQGNSSLATHKDQSNGNLLKLGPKGGVMRYHRNFWTLYPEISALDLYSNEDKRMITLSGRYHMSYQESFRDDLTQDTLDVVLMGQDMRTGEHIQVVKQDILPMYDNGTIVIGMASWSRTDKVTGYEYQDVEVHTPSPDYNTFITPEDDNMVVFHNMTSDLLLFMDNQDMFISKEGNPGVSVQVWRDAVSVLREQSRVQINSNTFRSQCQKLRAINDLRRRRASQW